MRWKSFQMPKGVEIDKTTFSEQYGKFVIEPLERGFGLTLGNALRRTLFSAIQGAAIVGVKIEGIQHEFSTIPGVVEDVTEIILNLKELRLKLHSEHAKTLHFKRQKKGEIKGIDLAIDPEVEILTPELHIATLSDEGSLDMEIYLDHGRGYVPAEVLRKPHAPIGYIAIDGIFSPVVKANFQVENCRVGEKTDYERLVLEVWTNKSIKPDEALTQGAKILKDHLAFFLNFEEVHRPEVEETPDQEAARMRELLYKPIGELELSVRANNCFKREKIKTLGDLVQRTEKEMLACRNFGRKSLGELTEILKGMGLSFGMDVSPSYPKRRKTKIKAKKNK
ncbi:MAG: DNA-directed RNA polymerase subunit alpha [Candidatus Edwardsbacteria bacterium]